MLRFVSDAETGSVFIDSWLPQYLTNLQAWEDGEPNEPPSLVEQIQPDGSTLEYYRADWRFAWTESPSIIADQIAGYAQVHSSWYRLQYHICHHDETPPSPCEWDETMTRSQGTIPEGI